MNRRSFIAGATTASVATISLANTLPMEISKKEKRYQNGQSPWPICLDTATIRPAKGLEKKVFQNSLPATKNRMRMASEIGCTYVQAIPNQVGENYDVAFVASCYRRLLEIGIKEYNVIPAMVFVKMFPLKTMGQATAVALDANHPKAKIIPDVYHMYISEGGFEGLRLLNGDIFAIFQFNDAPKGMEIADMEDKHRVFPGDGILPLPQILKDLKNTGFNGCVSLELYNPEYYSRDLLEVAKTGLQKTLKVIKEAGV